MKRTKIILSIASGMVAGALLWAVAAPAPDNYTKVEATSLVRTPQNSWARAILFTDVLDSVPGGRARRLDRRDYLPMRLKTVGTVWIPEELALKFQDLIVGKTYSFGGTVDQISRRYFVIVDACYAVTTAADMSEHWIDMLKPGASVEAQQADISETVLQSLLLDAQNSLINLAQESQLTVAQLIEAQTDGGQRIAEKIVSDSLQGKLRAENKTAEEIMVGAVLALLQKQAVMEDSARLASESVPPPATQPENNPSAIESIPAEAAAVQEETQAEPVDAPEDQTPAPVPEATNEEDDLQAIADLGLQETSGDAEAIESIPSEVAAVQEETQAEPVDAPEDQTPAPVPEATNEEALPALADLGLQETSGDAEAIESIPAEVAAVQEETQAEPVDAPEDQTPVPVPEATNEENLPALATVDLGWTDQPDLDASVGTLVEPPAADPGTPNPSELSDLDAYLDDLMSAEDPTSTSSPSNGADASAASVMDLPDESIVQNDENPKAKTKKKKKPKVEDPVPALAEQVDGAVENAAAEPPPADNASDPELNGETIDFLPGPTLDESPAIADASFVYPESVEASTAGDQPVAPPPSSMLVVPMTEPTLDMVPLVSTAPTKAELAQQQKAEALRKKEEQRMARAEEDRLAAERKKAAKEEAKRIAEEKQRAKEEARLQASEAKRIAAEEERAEEEARKAEIVRKKAEENRAREEEAARKAAEWKARQEAARAEAEAKKVLQEKEKILALQEKEALEAVRKAELLAKQEEAARIQRERTEQRLAELEARRTAAEAALRETEERKKAELVRIQEEAAAKVAAEAAEQEARLAEERARKEESIRIAQEVAEQERRNAEARAARIDEENAARKAAQDRADEMELEIREMEEQASRAEANMRRELEVERKNLEHAEVDPPATSIPAPKKKVQPPSKGKDSSREAADRERRRKDAEQRKAEWIAQQGAEKAKAKQEPKAEKTQKPTDPSELPEWMQPVRF